jgi:hypothetical protein
MNPITKEQLDEIAAAAEPLQIWLRQNCHPHVTVLLTSERTELLEGIANAPCYLTIPYAS